MFGASFLQTGQGVAGAHARATVSVGRGGANQSLGGSRGASSVRGAHGSSITTGADTLSDRTHSFPPQLCPALIVSSVAHEPSHCGGGSKDVRTPWPGLAHGAELTVHVLGSTQEPPAGGSQ